jgi:hypothetical protein
MALDWSSSTYGGVLCTASSGTSGQYQTTGPQVYNSIREVSPFSLVSIFSSQLNHFSFFFFKKKTRFQWCVVFSFSNQFSGVISPSLSMICNKRGLFFSIGSWKEANMMLDFQYVRPMNSIQNFYTNPRRYSRCLSSANGF